jgi:SpoVK/Ycf46/Vps4 family AAA+-type ATPase
MKDFLINYEHLRDGNSAEWSMSYVIKNILSSGLTLVRLEFGGIAKKDVKEILKELVQIVPNGKIILDQQEKSTKATYDVVDVDTYLSYLNIYTRTGAKNSSVSINLICADSNVREKIKDYLKENLTNKKKDSIYVIAQGQDGLQLHSLGAVNVPLEEGNYTEEVLEDYAYVVEQFNKEEPYGRLAIINGAPGGGKTFLVKNMISQMKDCLTVLLPSKLAGEIDSPALITLLAEEKSDYGAFGSFSSDDLPGSHKQLPILFIIEDADACLVPRQSDNVLTISSLLNYTDGLLGTMLDLRVVATTNAERIEFDEALTRPGRMCRHIHVPDLEPKKASEVYERLTGKKKPYGSRVSLAQVYADANQKFKKVEEEKKTVGFQ